MLFRCLIPPCSSFDVYTLSRHYDTNVGHRNWIRLVWMKNNLWRGLTWHHSNHMVVSPITFRRGCQHHGARVACRTWSNDRLQNKATWLAAEIVLDHFRIYDFIFYNSFHIVDHSYMTLKRSWNNYASSGLCNPELLERVHVDLNVWHDFKA